MLKNEPKLAALTVLEKAPVEPAAKPAKAVAPGEERKMPGQTVRRLENIIIFGLAVALNLLAAYMLTFVWKIGNSDALSRNANGFYVLFSRDPHLAAIGFIWPPLSSFLQLPFLFLTRWLGYTPFAGSLVSSLFGGFALILLNKVLTQLNCPRWVRWSLLAFTQLNPGYWYLAGSGLAEIILLCFLLMVVLGFTMLPDKTWGSIIIGMGLALAFLVRYEALAMIGAIVVAVIIQKWAFNRNWRRVLEGRVLIMLVPPFYAIGLWIFWNWQFMGDPLFFQRSKYSLNAASDVARNAGPYHPLYEMIGNVGATAGYAVTRLMQQNVAFLPLVLIVAGLALWQRNQRLLGLLLLVVSVPSFSSLQVYLGTLAPWLRYWFYATPFAAVLVGAVAGVTAPKYRRFVLPPLVLLFAAGIIGCLFALGDKTTGLDDQRLHALIFNEPAKEASFRSGDSYWKDVNDSQIVAAVLDQKSADGLVMVDSVTAYNIIANTKHPERLVISNDSDFNTMLENPAKYVRYILILQPDKNAGFNVIEASYPRLFDEGAPWAILERDFTETLRHWRLYRIR